MSNQQTYYKEAQNWMESEELPTEEELARLEKGYQDWIREVEKSQPLEWDWEISQMDSIEDGDMNHIDSWENDEDIDLEPDWEEYWSTGRLY